MKRLFKGDSPLRSEKPRKTEHLGQKEARLEKEKDSKLSHLGRESSETNKKSS
jgi:hypothetical protein